MVVVFSAGGTVSILSTESPCLKPVKLKTNGEGRLSVELNSPFVGVGRVTFLSVAGLVVEFDPPGVTGGTGTSPLAPVSP